MRVLTSPEHLVLGVKVTIQEEVGFIRKQDNKNSSSSSLYFEKNWHMVTPFAYQSWSVDALPGSGRNKFPDP